MRKRLIVVVFLALAAGTACSPVIFASSDSPDRKLRCEVYEALPSFLGELFGRSKPRYYFKLYGFIEDKFIGGSEGYEYGDGRIELDSNKLEFKWSNNELTVINHGTPSPQVILIASFDSQGQQWKQVN